MASRTIAQTSLGYSFNPNLADPILTEQPSMIHCWFDRLTLWVDTSGSTNNNSQRSRRGGYSTTKPIILAELEGIVSFIVECATCMDLGGLEINLYCFSSDTQCIWSHTLATANWRPVLHHLMRTLADVIPYEQGGTTLQPLANMLQEYLALPQAKTVLVVLATDGQPTDKVQVQTTLARVQQLRLHNFALVTLGAGSLCSGTVAGCLSMPAPLGRTESIVGRNAPQGTSCSEVDAAFLRGLIAYATQGGCYIGAFKDYADVHTLGREFLTQVAARGSQSVSACVVLDDGSPVSLPNAVSSALIQAHRQGQSIVVMARIAGKWYLYYSDVQVAILPPHDTDSDDIVICTLATNPPLMTYDNIMQNDGKPGFHEYLHQLLTSTSTVLCQCKWDTISDNGQRYLKVRQVILKSA